MKQFKRLVLITLGVFYFAASTFAQSNEFDTKVKFKGLVKKLEVIDSSSGIKDVYTFDKTGELLESANLYKADNHVWTKTVCIFDNAGKNVGLEHYKEDVYAHKAVLAGKTVFRFDSQGRVIERVFSDAEGKENSKAVLTRDANGNVIEQTVYIVKPQELHFGMLTMQGDFKTTFAYDEANNLIGVTSYLPGVKTPVSKQNFVYNKQKQIIESIQTSVVFEQEAPRIFRGFSSYNEYGDQVGFKNYESLAQSNVPPDIRGKVTVTKEGAVKYNLTSDKPGMIMYDNSRCDYEYDSSRNWTKQTCRAQTSSDAAFVVTSTTRRIFSYF